MKIVDFSLSIGNKQLLENVTVEFINGTVNHVLGRNGVGKSCLARALIGALSYKGVIEDNREEKCVIGTYSNLPSDLKVKDLITIIQRHTDSLVLKKLMDRLQIRDIPMNSFMKSVSDGQRQKIKLLFFLSLQPKIIVLDEMTNALDKASCLEIYKFLKDYIKIESVTVINITHNLMDLEYLDGNYYLFDKKTIITGMTQKQAIDYYIKG